MDNLPNPLLSPSKAAEAASISVAWSEINAFLAPLFHPHPIPPFERNPTTLDALRSLLKHSTALTEQETLLASTQAQALSSLRSSISPSQDSTLPVLSTIVSHLNLAGQSALESLSELSATLGSVSSAPDDMAMQLVNLTRSESDIAQQLARVEILHQRLKSEHALAQELLDKLHGEAFQPAPGLAEKTAEWSRGTKQAGLKRGEYRERSARLEHEARGKGGKKMGLNELKVEERELRDLEARVRGLEGRVRGFEGLPPDKEMALLEVERMRRELEGLVRKRDGMFEGLVERVE